MERRALIDQFQQGYQHEHECLIKNYDHLEREYQSFHQKLSQMRQAYQSSRLSQSQQCLQMDMQQRNLDCLLGQKQAEYKLKSNWLQQQWVKMQQEIEAGSSLEYVQMQQKHRLEVVRLELQRFQMEQEYSLKHDSLNLQWFQKQQEYLFKQDCFPQACAQFERGYRKCPVLSSAATQTSHVAEASHASGASNVATAPITTDLQTPDVTATPEGALIRNQASTAVPMSLTLQVAVVKPITARTPTEETAPITNGSRLSSLASQLNTTSEFGDPPTWVHFEDKCFAEGSLRRAYRGIYQGSPRDGQHCVVKLYKEEWYSRLNEYAWEADNRASRLAQEMAQRFNRNFPRNLHINFIIPEFSSVRRNCSSSMRKGALIAIEKYISGEYIHFVSNGSFVNTDVPLDTLVAFSHFTFHESHGKILVCDLQGARHENCYELTDPAIHSAGESVALGFYGATDLGLIGMIRFFKNHGCNDLCRRFRKPDLSSIPRPLQKEIDNVIRSVPKKRSCTYVHDLHALTGYTPDQLTDLSNRILKAASK